MNKKYMRSRLTTGEIVGEGLAWGVLLVVTCGLALPVCLLGIAKRVINSIDISETPPGF